MNPPSPGPVGPPPPVHRAAGGIAVWNAHRVYGAPHSCVWPYRPTGGHVDIGRATVLRDFDHLLALAAGATCLALGVLVRLGRMRRPFLVAGFPDESTPTYLRNGPYILIPFGLALLTGVLGAELEARGREPPLTSPTVSRSRPASSRSGG